MKKIIQCCLILILAAVANNTYGQCYPLQAKTAAFATGGTSVNKNQVLWLTWGSTAANFATNPYGTAGVKLANGAGSYASIDVGGGRFLCVEAVLTNIVGGGGIRSYAPGNYAGDSMDDLYNIGGVGSNNKLISGLINGLNGGLLPTGEPPSTSFTVTCKATIQGLPVKLYGLVIGDAESLGQAEHFSSTADGIWNIVELKKNPGAGAYNVNKVNNVGTQTINFLSGNDNNTAAVSFCTFNQTAFSGTDFQVTFQVNLKGNGLTAIALGVLPPGVDEGDAPESYGNPLHTIDRVGLSSDGITAGTQANAPIVNLNSTSYSPGALLPPTAGFLGNLGPDIDVSPLYSKDAMGDNNNGNAGVNEENAWPIAQLTYNAYKNLKTTGLSVVIPYKGLEDAYITGWIDFNANGVFEDTERAIVAAPLNATSATLKWTTIPADTKFKSTFVRLRYAKNQVDILSPTTATPGGEVEDFKLRILTPAITNPMLPSKVKLP